jgi:hypothetical protein
VAEDHGSPGAEEVEVAVAVLIVEPGALGVGDEGWVAADGTEGADGRVDSAGEERFGALLKLAGASVGERHLVQYRSVESMGWPTVRVEKQVLPLRAARFGRDDTSWVQERK